MSMLNERWWVLLKRWLWEPAAFQAMSPAWMRRHRYYPQTVTTRTRRWWKRQAKRWQARVRLTAEQAASARRERTTW